MRYVYLLRSSVDPRRTYVGLTHDLSTRLDAHNRGEVSSTARHRPWAIDVVVRFREDERAIAFERYLKSGSGRAFARRHLW